MKPAILIAMLSALASVLHCRELRGGTIVLDQSTPTTGFNEEIGFGGSSPSQFQAGMTFTVGIAGILNSVTLFVFENNVVTTDLFEIRSTVNGAPSSNVLASETITIPLLTGGFNEAEPTINIDVSSFELPVTVGEKLFFDIGGAPNLSMAGFGPSVYSGGSYYLRDPSLGDNVFTSASYYGTLGFQTYVQIVPEPSTIALVFAACVTLLARQEKARGRFRAQ
jgi:hypothetical protein